MIPEVEKICNDIRAMRIQGAREVAKTAFRALNMEAQATEAVHTQELLSDLLETADELASTRPTEPMLRNSLRYAFSQIKKNKPSDIIEFKEIMAHEEKVFLKNLDLSISAIAEYGAKEIRPGSTVLVHCHSHTVVAILRRTQELDKDVRVICTETRPRYQGRITARELVEAGLDVTMVVDSAARLMLEQEKVETVLVGADAVTSRGDLFNKIGTSMIALSAYETQIPFYSAAELYKFDPATLWGQMEKIEERDPAEVFNANEIPGLKIRNPAFDVTLAKYITAYITEMGIVPPQGVISMVYNKMGIENPMNNKR
ncbi:MAG: S-methyl-5-thioribose-1-phosphate isomerase [Candidatus Micrarchaeota archaeon]|nr:S-methyl-5-thioribose-1-phosphate isomerase [Candidatus Micrarchaeota archaeon]